MSLVTTIILIIALVCVIAILGVRAGYERGTKVEHRPSSENRKDID